MGLISELKVGDIVSRSYNGTNIQMYVSAKDGLEIKCKLTLGQILETSPSMRRILELDEGPTWTFSALTGMEVGSNGVLKCCNGVSI